MRKPMLMTSLVVLLNSPFSSAEIVSFPEEIIPLQVDERVLESSLFGRIDQLDLAPGHYQLKLKYSDLYEDGYDGHEVIESEPFWVSIDIATGAHYSVIFNRANNIVAAKAFAELPKVSIKTNKDAVAEPLTTLTRPQPASAAQKKDGKRVPNAADMLDFWWQQATPMQRKVFLQKVSQ